MVYLVVYFMLGALGVGYLVRLLQESCKKTISSARPSQITGLEFYTQSFNTDVGFGCVLLHITTIRLG